MTAQSCNFYFCNPIADQVSNPGRCNNDIETVEVSYFK